MLVTMREWQRGSFALAAALWLAACLDAPPSSADGDGDVSDDGGGSGGGDGGAGGIDAGRPVCGDGTELSVAHVSEIEIPSSRETIQLDGLAVFMNTGTTTIHTGQIRIGSVVTIGSADLDIAIANGVGEMLPGEAHGFLDATSRPLITELVQGLWNDQARPQVFGSITHVITSGTFEGTVVYQLGDYEMSVDITFSVGGNAGAIGGRLVDATCGE
jgi:hypothetical protein